MEGKRTLRKWTDKRKVKQENHKDDKKTSADVIATTLDTINTVIRKNQDFFMGFYGWNPDNQSVEQDKQYYLTIIYHDVFYNEDLLRNIRKSNGIMIIYCNAGFIISDMIGNLSRYGKV